MRRKLRNDALGRFAGHPLLQHRVEAAADFGIAQALAFRRHRQPAVVQHALRHGVVVVGEEFQLVVERRRPGDVVPQNRGPIAVDQLAGLRIGIGRIVATRRRAHEIAQGAQRLAVERPVDAAGIIDTETQPRRAHGIRQLADDVARARPVLLVRIGHGGGPQAETVVMLGDEDDVFGAGIGEGLGPVGRIPSLQPVQETGAEILVGCVVVGRGMEFRAVALRHLDRVPVPFAIRRLGDGDVVLVAEGLRDRSGFRREGGDREQAPMDEDAELGILEPLRHGMRGERVERGFIGHARP